MNWELVNISRINFMLRKYQWQGIGSLGTLSNWMMKNMGKKTKSTSLTGTDSRHDNLVSFFLDRNGAENDIIPELVAGI